MACKHKRLKCICFFIVLGLAISTLLYYYAQMESKEQYLRNFYRADIQITQKYYYAYQKVYDNIVGADYDESKMIAFFKSTEYANVLTQMEAQVNECEKLYEQYPVVDFSTMKSMKEDLRNLNQFENWVFSEEFKPEFAESYFQILGLCNDRAHALAEMDEYMLDPNFPRKTDNLVNNTLGQTILSGSIH